MKGQYLFFLRGKNSDFTSQASKFTTLVGLCLNCVEGLDVETETDGATDVSKDRIRDFIERLGSSIKTALVDFEAFNYNGLTIINIKEANDTVDPDEFWTAIFSVEISIADPSNTTVFLPSVFVLEMHNLSGGLDEDSILGKEGFAYAYGAFQAPSTPTPPEDGYLVPATLAGQNLIKTLGG